MVWPVLEESTVIVADAVLGTQRLAATELNRLPIQSGEGSRPSSIFTVPEDTVALVVLLTELVIE